MGSAGANTQRLRSRERLTASAPIRPSSRRFPQRSGITRHRLPVDRSSMLRLSGPTGQLCRPASISAPKVRARRRPEAEMSPWPAVAEPNRSRNRPFRPRFRPGENPNLQMRSILSGTAGHPQDPAVAGQHRRAKVANRRSFSGPGRQRAVTPASGLARFGRPAPSLPPGSVAPAYCEPPSQASWRRGSGHREALWVPIPSPASRGRSRSGE